MNVSRLFIRTFGALSDRTLSFGDGITIILGPNEAGKSTIFRALMHTLLTPTSVDKRTFDRNLAPLMPRPDGNSVETEVMIAADGEYLVKKRWGADPYEEVQTPDGAIVRGSPDVAQLIARLVPVGLGSFRSVFLADQSQLDQTLAALRDSAARDDVAAVLRQAAFDTGGVSVDLFVRRLDSRVEELLGRWDSASDRPEDGRNYNNPWKQRAGLVVKAFYDLQRSEAELQAAQSAEHELDLAAQELERVAEQVREARRFVEANAEAHRRLRETRGIEGQIDAAQERLRRLREVNRRWPVAESDLVAATSQVAELRRHAETLDDEVANSALISKSREIVSRFDRLQTLRTKRNAQTELMNSLPAPTKDDLETLRKLDAEIAATEAGLTAGTLRVSLTTKTQRTFTVRVDRGEESTQEIGTNESYQVSANRHIELVADDVELRAEAGEEDFESIHTSLHELRAHRSLHLKRLGVASTVSAEQALADQREAAAEITRFDDQISDLLGSTDESAFEAEVAGARNVLSESIALGSKSAHVGDTRDIASRLAQVREEIGAANARCEQLSGELQRLGQEYQSQDKLEDQLGEVKVALAELETRLSDVDLPEGFSSVEEFIKEYEVQQDNLDRGSQSHTAARVFYAEMLGRQPEQSSEELATLRDDAKTAFARAMRSGRALLRLRDRARTIVGDLDDGTFDPYEERVAHYVSIMTDSAYSAAGSDDDDPVLPSTFQRAHGPALPYVLLSQGTQDTVALAIRLALAETLLGGKSAPLLLDDPLVDLDEARRRGAARAILEFASSRQVIFFTCHPEHSTLFPSARVIDMESSVS